MGAESVCGLGGLVGQYGGGGNGIIHRDGAAEMVAWVGCILAGDVRTDACADKNPAFGFSTGTDAGISAGVSDGGVCGVVLALVAVMVSAGTVCTQPDVVHFDPARPADVCAAGCNAYVGNASALRCVGLVDGGGRDHSGDRVRSSVRPTARDDGSGVGIKAGSRLLVSFWLKFK